MSIAIPVPDALPVPGRRPRRLRERLKALAGFVASTEASAAVEADETSDMPVKRGPEMDGFARCISEALGGCKEAGR